MECQKINLLDNTPDQLSKFRMTNWVEINDDSREMYNTNSQIKFKTSVLKSSLCNYSDVCIIVKGTIIVPNMETAAAAPNNADKKVLFKKCASFADCISEINNTQVNNAKDTDVVMPMSNLIEYSDNYSKTSGSLWKYCRDNPALNDNGVIVDFNAANVTDSFNKSKINRSNRR